MEDRISSLFPHEQAALIDALRRDISSEAEKALAGGEWVGYHQRNVKMVTRILQHLQDNEVHGGHYRDSVYAPF